MKTLREYPDFAEMSHVFFGFLLSYVTRLILFRIRNKILRLHMSDILIHVLSVTWILKAEEQFMCVWIWIE